jgi:XTP/dITP diphosphohydrolase
MKLVFATSNQHKLAEVLSMLPEGVEVTGLKDIGFTEELPETRDTIEGNSLQKAEYLATALHCDCFAEDTGLEVEALNGAPGVYSARYAGENATFEDNVNKLLSEMKGVANRKARFKTVITYYSQGKHVQFEGITEGLITLHRSGEMGFGYDPVFIPNGAEKTYAEMTLGEKNIYSHRKKSFERFANYLAKNAV